VVGQRAVTGVNAIESDRLEKPMRTESHMHGREWWGAELESTRVVTKFEALEIEVELSLRCEPAGEARGELGETVATYEEVAESRPSAEPLQRSGRIRVDARSGDVHGNLPGRLIPIDHAPRSGSVGDFGDRSDILDEAGRVENVRGRDHERPVVHRVGVLLDVDADTIRGSEGDELDLRFDPELVGERREVELAADDTIPSRRQ